MKRITDKDFVYVNAANTDIRKTFERARLALQAKAEADARDAKEREQKLFQIARKK